MPLLAQLIFQFKSVWTSLWLGCKQEPTTVLHRESVNFYSDCQTLKTKWADRKIMKSFQQIICHMLLFQMIQRQIILRQKHLVAALVMCPPYMKDNAIQSLLDLNLKHYVCPDLFSGKKATIKFHRHLSRKLQVIITSFQEWRLILQMGSHSGESQFLQRLKLNHLLSFKLSASSSKLP